MEIYVRAPGYMRKCKLQNKYLISWWRHQMETFSALLAICAGNSPVFPIQRPVTRSFDVFFDLRLNKRLSKQSWGWWFETLPHPLWRHSNVLNHWYDECIFITFIILIDTAYLSVLPHFCKDTILLNNTFYKMIYSVLLLASDQKPFESLHAWCSFYILDVCNRWDKSFKLFSMTNVCEIAPHSLPTSCHEYLSHCFVQLVWHIMANTSIYHYQSVRTSKKTTKSSAMLNNASERLCFSSATRGGSSSSSDEVQRSQFELSNSIPAAICRLDALISVLSAKEAGRNHIIVICEIKIDNQNTSRNGPFVQKRLCTYVFYLFQFKWESVICLYLLYIISVRFYQQDSLP